MPGSMLKLRLVSQAVVLLLVVLTLTAEGKDLVDQEFCGEDDCYEILNVTTDATRGEIRRGYHQMSLKYHPDKVGEKSDEEKAEANAIFIKVANAYEILSDEKKRQGYDIWVRGGRKRRPGPEDYDGPMPSYYRDDSVRDVQDTPAAFAAVIVTLVISVGVPLCMSVQSKFKKKKSGAGVLDKILGKGDKAAQDSQPNTPHVSRKERRGRDAKPRQPSDEPEVANIEAIPAVSNTQKAEMQTSGSSVTKVSGPWSPEEDAELQRAVAKLPGGTVDRWTKVAAMVGTRTEEDCIARAADLKKKAGTKLHSSQAVGPAKPDAEAKVKPATNETQGSSEEATKTKRPNPAGGQHKVSPTDYARLVKEAQGGKTETVQVKDKAWTQEEQALLENAMRLVDKTVEDRWDRIAEMVPNRTKKQVVARVKELKEMLNLGNLKSVMKVRRV